MDHQCCRRWPLTSWDTSDLSCGALIWQLCLWDFIIILTYSSSWPYICKLLRLILHEMFSSVRICFVAVYFLLVTRFMQGIRHLCAENQTLDFSCMFMVLVYSCHSGTFKRKRKEAHTCSGRENRVKPRRSKTDVGVYSSLDPGLLNIAELRGQCIELSIFRV